MRDNDADVLVLGFGAAGAAAAITAHDLGARITIVEKMPEELAGGSTRVSGNVWYGPDESSRAATYLRNLAGERSIPSDVVESWSTEVTGTSDWVRSLGVDVGLMELPKEFPELDGCDSDHGFYHVMPEWGHGRLYNALKRAVEKRQITIRYGERAIRLAMGNTGKVTGVRVESCDGGRVLRAGAVVLATGGFTNNPDLARTYLRLPNCSPWGSDAATGDGLFMAQKAGAGLANMENYMGMIGFTVPGMANGFNVVFPATNWFAVDENARRFDNETTHNKHGKVLIGTKYKQAPDRPFYAIFDETVRTAGPIVLNIEAQGHGFNQRVAGYRWSADNSVEIERGWIARADTLAELAAKLGLDAAQLISTAAQFNIACQRGEDHAFGRDPANMAAVETPPFYAFKWDGMLVFTNGGPRKNGKAQVLDAFGEVIPGLYAAGEVASTYSHCMAGGQMIADALAFGRIAGRNASSEVLDRGKQET